MRHVSRFAGVPALLLLLAADVTAQTFEVGGSVGFVCRGSEGSSCGGESLMMPGAFASIWLDDRLELQGRLARGPMHDRTFDVSPDGRFPPGLSRVTVFLEDRRLGYGTLQGIYHFRRGERLRPMLGLGLGSLYAPRTRRCIPAGCDAVLELLAGPPKARATGDLVIMAGLNIRASSHLSVRLGFSSHNFAGESLSSEEWTTAISWRFGN